MGNQNQNRNQRPPRNQQQQRNQNPQAIELAKPSNTAITQVFGDQSSFNLAIEEANYLSRSTMVPKDYRGNAGNCMIALEIAARHGGSVLGVMQKLVIVNGTPSFEAQYIIGLINKCPRFINFDYEWKGVEGADDWGCRAVATRLPDRKLLVGQYITIKFAKDMGWWSKKDKDGKEWSFWPKMTEQMMCYRAASFWQARYAPELSMGIRTTDEVKDIQNQEIIQAGPAQVVNAPPAQKQNAEPGPETAKKEENPEFSVYDELRHAMTTAGLGGNWVRSACQEKGWDSMKLTEQQAGILLDIVNEGVVAPR